MSLTRVSLTVHHEKFRPYGDRMALAESTRANPKHVWELRQRVGTASGLQFIDARPCRHFLL